MKRSEFFEHDELDNTIDYLKVPNSILESKLLTPGQFRVLIKLIHRLGKSNDYVWPQSKTIARNSAMTRQGVRKILHQLHQKGILWPLWYFDVKNRQRRGLVITWPPQEDCPDIDDINPAKGHELHRFGTFDPPRVKPVRYTGQSMEDGQ